ncbi:MAG: pyridoxal phosphate-dependent aminotransferase [Bacillota bacterium]
MSIALKIRESLTNASFIRKMFDQGEELRQKFGAENVYDFTLGNPDLEPPAAFQERIRELAAHPVPGMHKYMSNAGYDATRDAVAANLNRIAGQNLTANHVVMTVGAGGGLNVIFKTLLNPGDEVLVNSPYFVEYGFYTDNHQGKLVVVKSRPDFQLDLAAIELAITPRTKAVLINSPNNPTGVVYTEETLRDLAALLKQKENEYGTTIYLVSDEPYAGLVYDGVKVPPVLSIFDHAIVATSHSKDLALPGERIGYVAINPKIPEAEVLCNGLIFANRVLGFVNAPALMQRLVADLQGLVAGVDVYRERRDLLYNHLVSIGFEIVKPQGAFYLFPKSPIPDDVAFINAALEYNLLLVPGSGFAGPGYFRIAYCVAKETIVRSLPYFTKLAEEFGLKKA